MSSPTMRRKTLGAELRKMRNAHGLPAEEIASLLGCSVAKVRHMENGRTVPSKAELKVLMDHYGVVEDRRASMEETREAARKRGWWSSYRLQSWFQEYVGLESDAVGIRTFEIEILPGLLQTSEYIREIHRLGNHVTAPEDLEIQVALRLKRQERLTIEPVVEYACVISEAALARCASQVDVAGEQFSHLIEMAKRPNISIQVLPFSAGLHRSMTGAFVLLDFPPGTWEPAVYQEHAVGGHLSHDRELASGLSGVFDDLSDRALTETESIKVITEYSRK
ncbi:helix-turn-helix domain-containing protein [Saccharopolyspora hirsuta]|uniref:Helix-turn-helix domain-containing protein n=1 Tax=Saccharopolyspora hirsuta TaxID=1837 RepID=A0A5M7C794_SACHI|nr:helix-turn-helix transcriptional regulator [Saccharopolyspora hirsuta]KAA5836307.1 helix-turn-helix domain-containing protein [Saccharopolyspora hirsuta]